ncbi:MAG: hypothetical protein ACFFD5_15250 [Candidatus Thorarchaeota archaeon]
MIEVELNEFEEFYKEKLTSQFTKIKKVVNKLILNIRESLIEIKVCMDDFIKVGEEKIDEKSLRSLHFFSDRIRKEIDEIKIPEEEINYDNINTLLNSIKRLFTSINEIARKSLPKFHKEVQPQIKTLNYITRKLGKNQKILDDFLRKKYTELREAENLLKRLPKFFSLKENIEKSKTDLDNFEKELKEREDIQEELNRKLINLEKDDLFKELEQKKDDLFRLRIKINDQLGFKKALKKLKFELEKGTFHISNIDLNYLREFLKNSISILSNEKSDLPQFSALLVQLRHVLEENKLNLKSETKDKTIEQINTIFNQKSFFDDITNLKNIESEIQEIQDKIKQKGLAMQLDELKSEISSNTVKLEHLQNDVERKNKDYLRYLANLKEEREEFQKSVFDIIKEEIKLNITFSF